MAEIKTYEDGWDCEPKLQEAVNEIDKCHHFIYEIKNCVRSSELDYMVYEMRDFLNAAICKLEEKEKTQVVGLSFEGNNVNVIIKSDER